MAQSKKPPRPRPRPSARRSASDSRERKSGSDDDEQASRSLDSVLASVLPMVMLGGLVERALRPRPLPAPPEVGATAATLSASEAMQHERVFRRGYAAGYEDGQDDLMRTLPHPARDCACDACATLTRNAEQYGRVPGVDGKVTS